VRVEFTRLRAEARAPERAHDGDAGADLFSCERAVLAPGERASVGTGIAVAIPAGSAGLVVPRSGLALRHGIALVNAPGVVDSGYRGELRVLLLNTDRSEAFDVDPGMRIAQLIVVRFGSMDFEEVSALPASTRGQGGFGSTGLR
jgi:dUTP pyrophosphatase